MSIYDIIRTRQIIRYQKNVKNLKYIFILFYVTHVKNLKYDLNANQI